MGLIKGGKTFHGKVQIEFDLAKSCPNYTEGGDNSRCLFIDYKGKMITKLNFNDFQIGWLTKNIY